MKVYILVFIFQMLFNVFKTLEIKYTYEHKVRALLFNSVWINLVSLGSMYFAIDRMFKGDWPVFLFYTAGSVFGKYVAMVKVEDYRSKLYRFFTGEK